MHLWKQILYQRAPGTGPRETPPITPRLAGVIRAIEAGLWWFLHPAAWGGDGGKELQGQGCTAAAVRGRERTLPDSWDESAQVGA